MRLRQFQRLRVRGRKRLLDEQMLAIAKRRESVLVVHLRAAEDVDGIHILTLERADGIPAVLTESRICGAPRAARSRWMSQITASSISP